MDATTTSPPVVFHPDDSRPFPRPMFWRLDTDPTTARHAIPHDTEEGDFEAVGEGQMYLEHVRAAVHARRTDGDTIFDGDAETAIITFVHADGTTTDHTATVYFEVEITSSIYWDEPIGGEDEDTSSAIEGSVPPQILDGIIVDWRGAIADTEPPPPAPIQPTGRYARFTDEQRAMVAYITACEEAAKRGAPLPVSEDPVLCALWTEGMRSGMAPHVQALAHVAYAYGWSCSQFALVGGAHVKVRYTREGMAITGNLYPNKSITADGANDFDEWTNGDQHARPLIGIASVLRALRDHGVK